jgi:acyl-coenzyme A synthetase/AMP-(fatty) acid ligase
MQPILDPVKDDDEGAREIGFTLPQIYNASSVLFDNLEAGRGNNIAVITLEQSMSYQELCRKASRYGRALQGLGLTKGDRVLLLMDDTPEYPAAFFGAMRAGFVPMVINTQSPADLVRYYVEDSSAKIIVADEVFLHLIN